MTSVFMVRAREGVWQDFLENVVWPSQQTPECRSPLPWGRRRRLAFTFTKATNRPGESGRAGGLE